jgi:hypothetical protein
LVHEDIATDDRIERRVEGHLRRVTLEEPHVVERTAARAFTSYGKRTAYSIGADDFARGTDELGGQQRHITDPAADVEHPHARRDACFVQPTPSDRLEEPRLHLEAFELEFFVA